jgi:hypothetical protein
MNPFYSPYDALIAGLKARNPATAADKPELDDLIQQTQPKTRQLQAAYQTACEQFDSMAAVNRTLSSQLADGEAKQAQGEMSVIDEVINSPCPDVSGLAESSARLDRTTQLLRNAVDLVKHVRLPQAEETMLLALRDLRRSEHLEASLLAAATQAEIMARIDHSFAGMGSIGFVSENVEKLKSIADEAGRQAVEAERSLADFRARRESTRLARLTSGGITKAEAVYTAVMHLSQMSEEKQ